MTLESLKKQASRLAAYLGEKHRVNLKHASALEALAAVYGVRNWQTLSARAGKSQGEGQGAYSQQNEVLPLSWYEDGQLHVEVRRMEWQRHGVARGTTEQTEMWVRRHASLALDAEYGLILFDVGRLEGKTTLYPAEAVVFDLSGPQLRVSRNIPGSAGINLAKGLSPEKLRGMASYMAPHLSAKDLSTPGYASLFSTHESAVSLADLLELSVPVVVILPSQGFQPWCQFWMSLLTVAVVRQEAPWVLALPRMELFYGRALSQLAEQGRGIGCILRGGIQDKPSRNVDFDSARTVWKNSWHHVDLRTAEERTPDVLARLAKSPATCESGGQYRF